MSDLDPAVIMIEHRDHHDVHYVEDLDLNCCACALPEFGNRSCLPYQLAEALAKCDAERHQALETIGAGAAAHGRDLGELVALRERVQRARERVLDLRKSDAGAVALAVDVNAILRGPDSEAGDEDEDPA